MAEVGVLNLTIKDNSEQAGKGLNKLAGALRAVKTAMEGFNLSPVGQQVQALADSINKTQATTIKSLTGLFNAVSNFSKIKSFKIDVKPFEDLKNAIGDGFKIGIAGSQLNQLREAMTGDWGDGSGLEVLKEMREISQSFSTGATGFETMTGSIRGMADSIRELGNASKAAGDWRTAMMGGSDGTEMGENVAGGAAEGINNKKEEAVQAAVIMAESIINAANQALGIAGPSKEFEAIGEYAAEGLIEGLIHKESEVHTAAGQVADGMVMVVRDSVTGIEEKLDFSKFNIDNLPTAALGMTAEQLQNGAAEAYRFRDAIMETDAVVSKMRMNAELDNFKNKAESITKSLSSQEILSRDGVFNADWYKAKISEVEARIEELKQKADELSGSTKKVDAKRLKEVNYNLMYQSELLERLTTQYNELQKAKEAAMAPSKGSTSGVGTPGPATEGIEAQVRQIQERNEKLKELNDSMQTSRRSAWQSIGQEERQRFGGGPTSSSISNVKETAQESTEGFENVKSTVDGLKSSSDALTGSLQEVDNELKLKKQDASSAANGFSALQNNIQDTTNTANQFNETNNYFQQFIENIKKGTPRVRKLGNEIWRIIKRMAIRWAIKQITSGISEGIENVYRYSQAIGSSFAPAMDSAASSLAQMRNAVGAALAPAIQALIPLLQTVVNWFITGVNYINQFFAALNGQMTWTRALPQTEKAFKDQEKAAKNASNAVKDLLADWDELNIIQSDSSGGAGSGAASTDYTKMFEEVNRYDSWIKRITDGIKDQFGDIWKLAKRVGAVVLGWKLSNVFTGALATIAGLVGAAFALDITFKFTSMFDKNWMETGKIGWLIASAITPLLGGVLTQKILGSVLGGRFAKLAIPLSLGISAVADLVTLVGNTDVSALSKEGLGLSVLSALKTGGAAAYLAKTLMGHSLGASLKGGLAIAIATFGVAIGIKAVARAVQGADTAETIKGIALSSLAVGVGAGMFAKLVGASAIGALGFGAAAAGFTVLTLAAAIGVAALLTTANEKVQWGSFKATEEQIKAFVEDPNNGVFTVNPNTILSIIDPKIEVLSTSEEGLRATVDQVWLDVKKVTLGLDDKQVLDDLHDKIFGTGEEGSEGLIGQFKRTAALHQEVIETGLTLVPTATNNDGTTKEIIDKSSEAWKMLTGHMDDLGRDLAGHFERAYDEKITEAAKKEEIKTIAELSQMMSNISASITQGEQYEMAMIALEGNLSNLTQGSWDKLFEYVEEYKKSIEESYTKAYDQTTVSTAGLVSGFKTSMENEIKLAETALTEAEKNRHLTQAKAYEDEYNYWNGILTERQEGRQAAIDLAVQNARNDETIARINNVLASKIDKTLINEASVLGGLLPDLSMQYGAGYQSKIIESLFSSDGSAASGAEEQIKAWFNQLIDGAFGDDASTIEEAIRLGLLGYGDVIDQTVIDQLASSIGIDSESPEIRKAWKDMIDKLTSSGNGIEVPGVNDAKYKDSLYGMYSAAVDSVNRIKNVLNSLNGFSLSVKVNNTYAGSFSGSMAGVKGLTKRASGGFVRSGDLVMANENGNFEMMGKMGTQPVVANNQQIVAGISQGVEQANGGVESRLSTIERMLQQLIGKQIEAKAVPDSRWGQHNARSGLAFDRITG